MTPRLHKHSLLAGVFKFLDEFYANTAAAKRESEENAKAAVEHGDSGDEVSSVRSSAKGW